ncbi:MAG TPA: hydrogenase maturation protease [Bacteroidota bacterium]|nr:hydrogenase maturation protease [Bacteroidota bacterium]
MKKVLVIGYGNALRSDDGVGPWVAEQVASHHLPGVDVKTYHQLGVELAADLVEYRAVIFVDASHGEEHHLGRIVPEGNSPGFLPGHSTDPLSLCQLAREVYGAEFDVHVFGVPGERFEFGSRLSPEAESRGREAVDRILSLLKGIGEGISEAAGHATR